MARADLAVLARRLLTAFSSGDLNSMRALLAEDMVSYVTNRDGGSTGSSGGRSTSAGLWRWSCPERSTA